MEKIYRFECQGMGIYEAVEPELFLFGLRKV